MAQFQGEHSERELHRTLPGRGRDSAEEVTGLQSVSQGSGEQNRWDFSFLIISDLVIESMTMWEI